MNKSKKGLWITIAVILTVILAINAAFFIYIGNYYHADQAAVENFCREYPSVTVNNFDEKGLVVTGEECKGGIIFYPGGKVEYTAYLPLMTAFAARGYTCVLLKVLFRLAVLDPNAADGVLAMFPDIGRWYMAGHSLGGTIASQYVAKHTDDFDGLILLGAYTTNDLSDTSLAVLSVYGSNDGILNRKKYRECFSNLPSSVAELVIEGGSHAQFGMYGTQKGDGKPTITAEEQIEQTADWICKTLSEMQKTLAE